jgi:hypothetical protein
MDPNFLRWLWVKLGGIVGLTMIVVAVYRLALNQGEQSTYPQHRNVLLDKDIDNCPRTILLYHLKKEVIKWNDEGNQIVVAVGFNQDIRKGTIHNYFTMLNMEDLILDQHGSDEQNKFMNGTLPIDRNFATNSESATVSSYIPFLWGI